VCCCKEDGKPGEELEILLAAAAFSTDRIAHLLAAQMLLGHHRENKQWRSFRLCSTISRCFVVVTQLGLLSWGFKVT
jgi:hypothetical protein